MSIGRVLAIVLAAVTATAAAVSAGVWYTSQQGSSPARSASSGSSFDPNAQHGFYNNYVALGDSYSAGEGASGSGGSQYFQDTNDPQNNMCHRSKLAYSQLLPSAGYAASPKFVACSGAPLQDLTQGNGKCNLAKDVLTYCTEPPQDQALSSSTDLVTISMGGNDLKFADTLAVCINDQKGGQECDDQVSNVFDKILPDVMNKEVQAYQQIHVQAPNAKIIVLGYPQLFDPNKEYSYALGLVSMPQDSVKLLDDKAAELDSKLRDAVNQSGVATYVSSLEWFKGHEADSSDPWLNELQCHSTGCLVGQPEPESFHPNDQGQQQFAYLIENQLKSTGDNPNVAQLPTPGQGPGIPVPNGQGGVQLPLTPAPAPPAGACPPDGFPQKSGETCVPVGEPLTSGGVTVTVAKLMPGPTDDQGRPQLCTHFSVDNPNNETIVTGFTIETLTGNEQSPSAFNPTERQVCFLDPGSVGPVLIHSGAFSPREPNVTPTWVDQR